LQETLVCPLIGQIDPFRLDQANDTGLKSG